MSVVTLTPLERKELERRARSKSLLLEPFRRRAKVILMLSAGLSYSGISKRLGCTLHYISYWKGRFKQKRLIGLNSGCPGAERRPDSSETEARILEWTGREPTDGSTHWSSHRLAKEMGVSQSTVSRVWRKFGLRPPRWPGYMASDDPGFEEKAADIIGLYIRRPVHAAAFCVGEKSAIQALDLLDPVFPHSPGGAGGTFSLYSALNTPAGEQLAAMNKRQISAEFIDFLAQIVMGQPPGREVHVIAENLQGNKTKKFFEFLEANPTVRIHYAPTYSNWIDQIETWFSKIQRDVISQGVFSSVKELARKLIRYIRKYNKKAIPIRWIY